MSTDLRFLLAVLFASMVVVATAFASLHSVISLAFFLVLLLLIWRFGLRWRGSGQAVAVFFLYAGYTLALYAWQYIVVPDYFGFSGGLGIGTDDSYFYSLVAPAVPEEMPVREYLWRRTHSFAALLSVFSGLFVRLYGELHPLDLLFVNAMVLTFVPFLARNVAHRVTGNLSSARFTFWATLFCPFLISNSLILIREGWVTLAYIGAFYSVLSRRYVLLSLMLAGATYLRFEAGLLLAFSTGTLLILTSITLDDAGRVIGERWRSLSAVAFTSMALLAAGVAALFIIGPQNIFTSLAGVLYRGEFLESFIAPAGGSEGGGTFYRIHQLPWYLSTPLGFAFFLGSPFFNLRDLAIDGGIVPRVLLMNLFAVLFIWYSAYFARATVRVVRFGRPLVVVIFVIFVFDVLLLSQASLQLRHKVALMPLFYVILGYGYVYRPRYATLIGMFAGSSALIANILVLAR